MQSAASWTYFANSEKFNVGLKAQTRTLKNTAESKDAFWIKDPLFYIYKDLDIIFYLNLTLNHNLASIVPSPSQFQNG